MMKQFFVFFYFLHGVTLNENIPVIANREEKNYLNIMMTSMKLIKFELKPAFDKTVLVNSQIYIKRNFKNMGSYVQFRYMYMDENLESQYNIYLKKDLTKCSCSC